MIKNLLGGPAMVLREICRIDWDGGAVDEMVGKEGHKYDAGAIV